MDKYAWQAAAFYSAKRIISRKYRNRAFLAEHLLADVIKDIGETVDFRAFGGVVRSLSADGFIKRAGYAAAKSSNGSIKPKWIKSPNWGKLCR